MVDFVADDWEDRNTLAGRARWLGIAALRIGVSLLVIALFVLTLLAVTYRAQASAGLTESQEAYLQQLLTPESGLSSEDRAARWREAYEARDRLAAIENRQATQAGAEQGVVASGNQLVGVAFLAGCNGESAVDLRQAVACQPAASNEALEAARTVYQEQTAASLANQTEITRLTVQHQMLSLSQPGASLARAVPAIEQRDALAHSLPEPAAFLVNGVFAMPAFSGSALLALMAGMFGSVCLLLVLLTFPQYLPLTFGAGKYFLLRIATGGIVAVIVCMVLLTGSLDVPELTQIQGALTESNLTNPQQLALIGILAGVFSEQIAAWVKSYADRVVPGGGNVAPPPSESDAGLLSPGAQAELERRPD